MASLDLEDMRKHTAARTAAEPEEEDDDEMFDPTQIRDSLVNNLKLFRDCAVAFEFMSNPDLVKNISMRERNLMTKLANRIYDETDVIETNIESLEEICD